MKGGFESLAFLHHVFGVVCFYVGFFFSPAAVFKVWLGFIAFQL